MPPVAVEKQNQSITFMKKPLLLLASLMGFSAIANAAEPFSGVECPDHSFQHISPNGRYIVSDLLGYVIIYDLEDGTAFPYFPSEDGIDYYTSGVGNTVSNTGIVLASTKNECDAAYWQGGEWFQLDTTGANGTNNMANGITPDGSRICGSLAAHEITISEDALMMVPVYWDRNADGTYSECKALPHPTTDFAGRTPQYITAVAISDDGRTIVGQMTDCSGFVQQPIVYTQAADGSWSYKLLLENLFHPEGITLPPYPADAPMAPSARDFMSEAQREAYDAAIQAWQESGYATEAPDEAAYMTGDEIDAYEAAYQAYLAAYATWEAEYLAYQEAFEQITTNAPAFDFNNVYITPDGSKYISTAIVSEGWGWDAVSTGTPWVIDTATGEVIRKYEGQNLNVTAVPNNETILAWNGLYSVPSTGYVLKGDVVTPLHEYLSGLSTQVAEWVNSTLSRDIEAYDAESDEFVTSSFIYTGMPIASADMNTLAFWSTSDWDTDYVTMAYVLNLSTQTAIKQIAATTSKAVALDAAGNLTLSPEVASVEVYNAAGLRILASDKAASTLRLNGPRGIYLVKATLTDGTVTTIKLAK